MPVNLFSQMIKPEPLFPRMQLLSLDQSYFRRIWRFVSGLWRAVADGPALNLDSLALHYGL
jgi:hypothetical protein